MDVYDLAIIFLLLIIVGSIFGLYEDLFTVAKSLYNDVLSVILAALVTIIIVGKRRRKPD